MLGLDHRFPTVAVSTPMDAGAFERGGIRNRDKWGRKYSQGRPLCTYLFRKLIYVK